MATYDISKIAYGSDTFNIKDGIPDKLIGTGRNLITGTSVEYTQTKENTTARSATFDVDPTFNPDLLIGQIITYSYDLWSKGTSTVIGSGGTAGRFGGHVTIKYKDSSDVTRTIYPCAGELAPIAGNNDNIIRVYKTTNLSSYDIKTITSINANFQLSARPSDDNDATWYIGYPKLEMGKASTGWTPAYNDIASSIDEKVKKAGDTMTGKLTLKANQYNDAYNSGSLDLKNSNIDGVNSIYTADASDNAKEGIHFYRDSTHVDSIHANGGLYFSPNRTLGQVGANYRIMDSSGRTDADKLQNYLINHPEATNPVLIPTINNDLAFLVKKGGTISVTKNGSAFTNDTAMLFNGGYSYWSGTNPTVSSDIYIFEILSPIVFTYQSKIYIDFGNNSWKAKNVKIEVKNTNYSGDDWTQKYSTTALGTSYVMVNMSHQPVGASNTGGGFNSIRITLTDWNSTQSRIASIGVYNYRSNGLREVFLPRDGGDLYGTINPFTNNAYDVGTSSKKWANGYFNNINTTNINGSPYTTYSSMSQSEATTGTATTARSITAKVLHDSISEIADNYIPWGGTDQLERLTPDQSWTISGATYSQGMAGDGTYLYLTNRANSSATTAMKITRLNMSTMAVVDTHTVGQGHYNSLYYYEGKLYGTGVTSSNNYSKVSVIDTSTWSETIKDSPSTWGVGVRKFANKGYITALWVASQRAITYYDSYILDTSNKQTPLAKVTLDFTGSTTVQGSFHMTDRYIWTLETTYSDETRASGHQVIRCFTYGGMLVKAWYVDSITDELEDIWVSDDNLTAYVNTINGKIYKFTFPALYRTLTSSISEVGSLKSGTLKHVYSYPAPNSVSSRQTYTRGSSSYYFTRAFAISDFAFLGEIGEFIPPTLWLNNRPFKGAFYNNYAEIWFHGSYNWAGGGRLSFAFKFERTSDTYNYYYWLTRVQITGRDESLSSPRIEYNVSTTAGSWSSDMEDCISTMYTDGWFFGNFYIESLSYIVGIPNTSTDLAII